MYSCAFWCEFIDLVGFFLLFCEKVDLQNKFVTWDWNACADIKKILICGLMQCEATFVNKMAKIRQETEAAIHEVSFQARFQVFQYVCIFRLLLVHCAANGLFFQANTRLNQAERDRAEVLHLQNTFRLSWVPDEVRIDLRTLLRC